MQTLLDNRYRVIQTLGGGGFGETFLAEDTQMPSQRRCVIKQLRPIQNNPQIYQLVQERFQREAAILEDLGGYTDQIPTLYAYFQLNGQFYLIQEWIEGDTLTAKVQKQGLFSESAVKDLLVNLLPVLEYVHSKRIIHRDIKPDNIIVRDRNQKSVLIDFGAVRESMGTVFNSQGNPTSSIIIGTPGYMPSEQAAGRPVYSSDLYSLGLTAIYLLTGKQPHELESDSRTGDIIWHTYALSVSPTLAGVIDRAIAYHPRERFATAREMLEALQLRSVPYNQAPGVNVQPPATPQNTIAVSPGLSSHQATNQNSGPRGIVIASLIAGGIIGASIIIGLALNKTPQPVAQSTPSTEASNTPKEQQNIQQSVQSPLPSEPSPSISSQPTSSPLAATTQEEVNRPSPAEAIENYYLTINQGQYQSAWNQLSPSFQSNKRRHPNGYLSYIDWWGEQVQSVDVQQVNLVQVKIETATVNAQLQYLMKNGKQVPGYVRFSLLWDAENSRWIISGTN